MSKELKVVREVTQEDPIISESEAAIYLTPKGAKKVFPSSTLKYWRTNGEGPNYVKIGRYVGYRLSALDRWLLEQEVKVGA